jgi:hygromycin-B 4-O-kinase
VQAFLTEHLGAEVSDVARLGGGDWSQAFSFRHTTGHGTSCAYVVRFGAFVEDFMKDRLAAGFASPELPIPLVTEIGQAFSGHFAISERAYGEMLDSLDSTRMHAVVPAVLRALDAARRVDVGSYPGYGGWDGHGAAPFRSWSEFLLDVGSDPPGSRCHGWRARLASSSVGEEPFTEAYGLLQSLVEECPEQRHLIHNDLLHDNVLVQEQRIAAVIDWGCALYGDFLYDLALLSFASAWYPAMRGIDWAQEGRRYYAEQGIPLPNFELRVRCYKLYIGLGAMAYNAFTRRWDELETTTRRTQAVARHSTR